MKPDDYISSHKKLKIAPGPIITYAVVMVLWIVNLNQFIDLNVNSTLTEIIIKGIGLIPGLSVITVWY